ncbi:very-short-patch-repair endonuclease [Microbacterium terrae]|uniref:DUF559 domain-containing protein n=1 Tax=Microbacterium terrae TaxID=69369 RepID=A0A0M2H9L0_9MICO|nr:DUF559 domain-containing protein [Microbacterium terrae]KJL43272.1 hypothetical protein RS81_00876 [Microbacterium terrae]MBP1078524.1 very-short-patch-repair endonuclease [Microbacterium terrae]GLJ97924.1 hypothetical protein GCM10017594_11210 [Microbacterium terrae]
MPRLLPERLGDRFTVRTARESGVSYERLRSADLERPFQGVRIRADRDDSPIWFDRHGRPRGELERRHISTALAYAGCMREGDFFSHITAAILWDIPLPPHVVAEADVDVSMHPPTKYVRRRGVVGHETRPKTARFREHPQFRVPVATPATTWAMLAGALRDPRDLVAAADAIVRTWRVDEPLATTVELSSAVAAGRRVGVGRLREALPHVRLRSGSRPETHLRLAIVDGMLPEPHLNFDVLVRGEKVACVDLAYPDLQIAIEYEGEHHLTDPAQWAQDIERYERLAAAGWHVLRVTKSEVFGDNRKLLERIRAAIHSRS